MTQDQAQTRSTHALAWLASAFFLASWFLPVLADVPGWMAFRYALAPLVPYRDLGASSIGWEDSVPQIMSALTNVVFVILMALWASRQSPRARHYEPAEVAFGARTAHVERVGAGRI